MQQLDLSRLLCGCGGANEGGSDGRDPGDPRDDPSDSYTVARERPPGVLWAKKRFPKPFSHLNIPFIF